MGDSCAWVRWSIESCATEIRHPELSSSSDLWTPLACKDDDLVAWFDLYKGQEAGANADNTIAAKTRDLEAFLGFFGRAIGSEHADLWTRSISRDYLR